MTALLWDTAALIAFFIRSEKHHRAIVQYVQTHPEQEWIILSTVFDETVTWLRAKASIAASIEIGQLLREEHRYISLSTEDDLATWEAFAFCPSKKRMRAVQRCAKLEYSWAKSPRI
jgi:uncharacterized protein